MIPSDDLNDSLNQFKRLIFERYLSTNVVVYIDDLTRCKGIPPEVTAPGLLLSLEYGLSMPNPILNFQLNDDGLYATLSFNRNLSDTFVPWEAIVAIFNPKTRFSCCWSPTNRRLFLMCEPLGDQPIATDTNTSKSKLSVVR
jgi:hypothetical protein